MDTLTPSLEKNDEQKPQLTLVKSRPLPPIGAQLAALNSALVSSDAPPERKALWAAVLERNPAQIKLAIQALRAADAARAQNKANEEEGAAGR